MKLCGVVLLFLISLSYGKILCPEQAIAVNTAEGSLCICTRGYYGANCLFKALPLDNNANSSNQTGAEACNSWHDCIPEIVSSWVTRPSFKYGMLTGVIISVVPLIVVFIIVKCSLRRMRQRNARESANKTMSVSDDVVVDIEGITRSQSMPSFPSNEISKEIAPARSVPCVINIY